MTDSDTIKEIRKEWSEYKQMLIERYPAEEGTDWEFSCDHHKRIDELLGE